MSTATDTTAAPTASQLLAGRLAAVLVGLEGLVLAAFAAFYLYELAVGKGTDQMVVIMSVVTMVIFVIGFAYTAIWLWRRHPRAQAPALAANGLLVPLGIAMFQFAPWWAAAAVLVAALAVIAGVLLMGRLEE